MIIPVILPGEFIPEVANKTVYIEATTTDKLMSLNKMLLSPEDEFGEELNIVACKDYFAVNNIVLQELESTAFKLIYEQPKEEE